MKENFINLVNTYCANVSLFIAVALIVSIIVMIAHKHYKSFIGMLIIMTAWIGCMIYAAGGDITIFFFLLAPLIGFRAYRAYLLCQPDGEYEKKLEKKRKLEQLNNEPLKYKVWLIVIAIMLITRVSEAQVFTSLDRSEELTGVQQDFMDVVDDIVTYKIGKRFSSNETWQSMSPFDKYQSDDYITYSYNIKNIMIIFVMVDDNDIVVSVSVKGANDDYSEQFTGVMFSDKWRISMRQLNNTREGEDGFLYAKSKQGLIYVYRDIHGYFRVSIYPK